MRCTDLVLQNKSLIYKLLTLDNYTISNKAFIYKYLNLSVNQ